MDNINVLLFFHKTFIRYNLVTGPIMVGPKWGSELEPRFCFWPTPSLTKRPVLWLKLTRRDFRHFFSKILFSLFHIRPTNGWLMTGPNRETFPQCLVCKIFLKKYQIGPPSINIKLPAFNKSDDKCCQNALRGAFTRSKIWIWDWMSFTKMIRMDDSFGTRRFIFLNFVYDGCGCGD